MSVMCEACGAAQPHDWTAGHHCVHCGEAVRREVRCFWCAEWTPAGGWCRYCGAECVEPSRYGAARMLKDAGVDRFSVPERLRTMPDAQVEHFERLYQQQAGVVARLVDDAAYLEQWLFGKQWSRVLEEQLTKELPWPPDTFALYRRHERAEDEKRARGIAESAPVPLLRTLAEIACLRMDDWQSFGRVRELCSAKDDAVREEAALAVTSWRVRTMVEAAPRRASEVPEIVESLRRSRFRDAAAVRLALLGAEGDLPADVNGSMDDDLAVPVAILQGDQERLTAVVTHGDAVAQRAAGLALVAMGCLAPLESLLRTGDEVTRIVVLKDAAWRKTGSPALRDALLELIEKHPWPEMREGAVRLLCKAAQPGDGLRMLRAGVENSRIVQCVLQAGCWDRDESESLLVELLTQGRFALSQFGVSTLAERGLVGDDFVPRHFHDAEVDQKTKQELLRFAELQLKQSGDEALHRFVMGVAFGQSGEGELRSEAWWCLHRWYRESDVRGESPLEISTASAVRFFGSMGELLRGLSAALGDPSALMRVGYYQDIERLLRTADVDALELEERAAWSLASAAVRMSENSDLSFTLRTEALRLVGKLGRRDRWREIARELLRECPALDLQYTFASVQEALHSE